MEDALDAHQRPKLEAYGDSVFVVLNTAQLAEDEVVVGETHLFVGPNYVVSVRHGASSAYTPVRERCESDPQGLANGPGYVLYALMDFVVDHYLPIVTRLEDTLEELEQGIFRDEFDRGAIENLYRVKRQVLRLPKGVVLIGLQAGGGAQRAGLQPFMRGRDGRIVGGDVITAVNGKPVADLDELLSELEERRVGDKVTLTVWNGGKTRQVQAQLGSD